MRSKLQQGGEGGTKLRRFLNERGISQGKFASMMRFEPTIVSLVANGKRRPGGEFKYRFARLFGVDAAVAILEEAPAEAPAMKG